MKERSLSVGKVWLILFVVSILLVTAALLAAIQMLSLNGPGVTATNFWSVFTLWPIYLLAAVAASIGTCIWSWLERKRSDST